MEKFHDLGARPALNLLSYRGSQCLFTIPFQIALELMYEKSQVDLITGLRTKTEAGRPDFNKVKF